MNTAEIIRELHEAGGTPENQADMEQILEVVLSGMGIGRSGLVEGGEKFALNHVKEMCKHGQGKLTIFDVGANFGQYSTLAMEIIENVQVHAFEPQKVCCVMLDMIRDEHKNYVYNRCVVSEEKGEVKLHYDCEGSGCASLYKRRLEHAGQKFNESEKVSTITIDSYCEVRSVSKIHMLKIDAEGHDLSVIKSAKSMINKNRVDFIQFEFGGTAIDSRTYFQDFWYLLKDRYKIYRMLENGLSEIKEYREHYEQFKCTNFLAEKRI